MAQTISELEKERAELLKAIESQAQQMSSSRPLGEKDQKEHTLNDWLHAAEEVMPSTPKRPTQQSSAPQSTKKTKGNKASFFGVVIMLSLLLTILGVVYIAYTSIHNELQKVLAVKEDSMKEVKMLKETVSELQKSVASGGQGELFTQLQKRVEALEAEVTTLKAQQLTLDSKVVQQATSNTTATALPQKLPSNVVTTEVLESKLKEYTQGIDQKLETILKYLNLSENDKTEPAAKVSVYSKPEDDVEEPTVSEPTEPKVKPLDQPVVRLVQKTKKPTTPEPKAPLENYTSDVKWLMEEPAFNYTLQLASMAERDSIEKMIEQKGLQGAKIIPLERKGEPYYVLLTGSYASRSEADKAAGTYKANFGISPWVRKIKDLSRKLK
ncbi:Cell division protein DamX [Hydrogenovibrio crunogenus]|uniref:Cell division protein DamX n=1 Tax=Hydrogenovibrio crunogenus TaxID=39765 RepID=A0A4P7NZZ3_9GAMM|nr:SPOR domain-containing protein [Hydrogenovibrio crunogenus]QBZ83373.1 Cell division protein DamX [Hydrogenovibrio crunogenus]